MASHEKPPRNTNYAHSVAIVLCLLYMFKTSLKEIANMASVPQTYTANGHEATINEQNDVKDHLNTASRLTDLLASVEHHAPKPLDELSRHRLMSSLHESAEELETPYDTMARLYDAVSVCDAQAEVPSVFLSTTCSMTDIFV